MNVGEEARGQTVINPIIKWILQVKYSQCSAGITIL
jgi:hypothetical protein